MSVNITVLLLAVVDPKLRRIRCRALQYTKRAYYQSVDSFYSSNSFRKTSSLPTLDTSV